MIFFFFAITKESPAFSEVVRTEAQYSLAVAEQHEIINIYLPAFGLVFYEALNLASLILTKGISYYTPAYVIACLDVPVFSSAVFGKEVLDICRLQVGSVYFLKCSRTIIGLQPL